MTVYYSAVNLENLLTALKSINRETNIKVYYDPDTWFFYLVPDGVLGLEVPDGARLISTGRPAAFYSVVCRILSLSQSEAAARP